MQCPDWMPTSFSRLCSDHFTHDAFNWVGATLQLRDDAVPTVFFSSPVNRAMQINLDSTRNNTTYLCNVNIDSSDTITSNTNAAYPSIVNSNTMTNNCDALHLCNVNSNTMTSNSNAAYPYNVNSNTMTSNSNALLDKLDVTHVIYDGSDMQLVAVEDTEELAVHFNISSTTGTDALTAVQSLDEQADIKPNPSLLAAERCVLSSQSKCRFN